VAVIRLQPEIRISVVDASDSIGHFGLWIRAGATAAQGFGALAQLRGLLPTDCAPAYGIVRYDVTELAPAAGAGDRTRCAVFIFETTTAPPAQLAVIVVPGLRPHLVAATTPPQVDMSNPAVLALIAALQSGLWCSPFGYGLGNCIAALVEIRP
jgi:hypothetical protein